MKLGDLIVIVVALTIPATLAAEVFIDWRGDFYVEYPDDWYQVDAEAVKVFLASQDVWPSEFDYDVMLAQKSQQLIFDVPYLFISFFPIGNLSGRQIDSALVVMSEEFGKKHTAGSLQAQKVQFRYRRPIYDSTLKAAAVLDKVVKNEIEKSVLQIRKFFDNGVVVFWCFAPRDMYNDALPVFLGILNSFSTENLDEIIPKDSITIVDVSERDIQKPEGEKRPPPGRTASPASTQGVLIIVMAVIILLVVWFFVAKMKK